METHPDERSGIPDLHLLDAVKSELARTADLNAKHIDIAVDKGVVSLTGEVSSLAEVTSATNAALRVRGATAIVNDISVQIPSEVTQRDREIAVALQAAIAWSSAIPVNAVKATVSAGRVTLTGEVEWNFQREEPEHIADRLVGVRAVDNQIHLPHRPTVEEAAKHIKDALVRSAMVEAEGIQVHIDGGVVTLNGEVRSAAAKVDATRAAWSSPYVTDVHNRLIVQAT